MSRLARPAAAALVVVAAVAPAARAVTAGATFGDAVLLTALALAGAAHGWGRALGWLVGVDRGRPEPVGPAGPAGPAARPPLALVVAWGAAAMILASGALPLVGLGGQAGHAALVAAGLVAHGAWLAARRAALVDRLAAALPRRGRAARLAPALLALALATLHVLGGAAAPGRTFDDDGDHLGQLARLRDTGRLEDAVGWPRAHQLGGQLAAEAYATLAGTPRALGLVDGGLGFGLCLALVLAIVGPRDARRATWATLLLLAASATPLPAADAAGVWLAAALALALYLTARAAAGAPPRARAPAAVVAAALASLRHELVPLAAALLVAAALAPAPPADHGGRRATARRVLDLLALAGALLAPLVLDRLHAFALLGPGPRQLLGDRGLRLGRLALALPGLALGPLLTFAVVDRRPGRPLVALAAATTFAAAAIALGAAGPPAHAARALAPILLAAVLAVLAEAAAGDGVAPVASGEVLLAALTLLLVARGRDGDGAPRASWSRRYVALAAGVGAAHVRPAIAPRPRGYEALLASVPAGARVATWVAHPDELDAGRHRVVDLRTPRLAWLRAPGWGADAGPATRLLHGLRARYLLLEDDTAARRRAPRDALYRALCTGAAPPLACDDALTQVARGGRALARDGAAALVELPSDGP